MVSQMRRWLQDYESRRSSKIPKEPNEHWVSSKYDTQNMHWTELQQLYLPELGMCWGPACSSLKRLWKSYKIAGRSEEARSDIAWKIRNIQRSMGIQETFFEELEGMDDEEEALSAEEAKLQREEQEEGEWNISIGTSPESYTDEWSPLDKQLKREEEEANDDWWFS
jgi:hypothetical protein